MSGQMYRFVGQTLRSLQAVKSADLYSAFLCARGSRLQVLSCDGEIVREVDMSEPLRYFARVQALLSVHKWVVQPSQRLLDFLHTGVGDRGASSDVMGALDSSPIGSRGEDAAWASFCASVGSGSHLSGVIGEWARLSATSTRDALRDTEIAKDVEDFSRQLLTDLVNEALA